MLTALEAVVLKPLVKFPVAFNASSSKVINKSALSATVVPFTVAAEVVVSTFFTGSTTSVSLILTTTSDVESSILEPVYSPAVFGVTVISTCWGFKLDTATIL